MLNPWVKKASMLKLNYFSEQRKCYFSAPNKWLDCSSPRVLCELINPHQREKERKLFPLILVVMAFIPALERCAVKISSMSPKNPK